MEFIESRFPDCPECGTHNWEDSDSNLICKSCGHKIEGVEAVRQTLSNLIPGFNLEPDNKKTQEYSDDLQNRIKDKESEGWKPLEFGDDRVIMGKPKKAGIIRHFVMFILTGWWTLGFGNAAYHEHKKRQYEKTVLRENKQTKGEEESPAEKEPADSLRSLEELRDEGLVSEEEYESKREDIIQNL